MPTQEQCFTPFTESINGYALPKKFTFPFYYEPHPLCILATQQLQGHLQQQTNWQHNFGLTDDEENVIGKMFGVLLVQKPSGEIGYLSAFSGKLAEQNLLPHFVPPVFDMLSKDSFFLEQQSVINALNEQLDSLLQNPNIVVVRSQLAEYEATASEEIKAMQAKMTLSRKVRKHKRAEQTSDNDEAQLMNAQLSQESINEKNQLKALKAHWQVQIGALRAQLDKFTDQIDALKTKRKILSASLQQQLFAQYRFLNAQGVEKDINDIFSGSAHPPPAGTGECAAPKLLQYAFKWQLKPLAMAEFWWGRSPKSEVRQHQNFYPACKGKCQPILAHMLEGIELDDNPLIVNPALNKSLAIIYQDDEMLVINKPAEFLSVPGKSIEDSVYLRIKRDFPHAEGPLIVHRLDMSTSGLMVIALNKRAHKKLQKQFINRSVEKRYVALLSGDLAGEQGDIDLPLRGDLYDRPRQLVCHQHGKPAKTRWQVIARIKSNENLPVDAHDLVNTKVYLYPKTGRTHQLRVHCAHSLGLNMPIVGDDLYGRKADRLYLHAEYLSLEHPLTKENMVFQVDAEF